LSSNCLRESQLMMGLSLIPAHFRRRWGRWHLFCRMCRGIVLFLWMNWVGGRVLRMVLRSLWRSVELLWKVESSPLSLYGWVKATILFATHFKEIAMAFDGRPGFVNLHLHTEEISLISVYLTDRWKVNGWSRWIINSGMVLSTTIITVRNSRALVSR
jgi:hypothetical protein